MFAVWFSLCAIGGSCWIILKKNSNFCVLILYFSSTAYCSNQLCTASHDTVIFTFYFIFLIFFADLSFVIRSNQLIPPRGLDEMIVN